MTGSSESTTPEINPLAEAFLARYFTKALLAVGSVLTAHGVQLVSTDGYQHLSVELADTTLGALLILWHVIKAKKINLHFFNLGRLVQSGAATATVLPASTVAIAPPPLVPVAATPSPSIDPTKPPATAPRPVL